MANNTVEVILTIQHTAENGNQIIKGDYRIGNIIAVFHTFGMSMLSIIHEY